MFCLLLAEIYKNATALLLLLLEPVWWHPRFVSHSSVVAGTLIFIIWPSANPWFFFLSMFSVLCAVRSIRAPHTGNPIRLDRRVYLNGTNLHINGVSQRSDGGDYVCLATARSSGARVATPPAKLDIIRKSTFYCDCLFSRLRWHTYFESWGAGGYPS